MPSAEARIHDLAGRQHGVVTRAQLLDAGLTPRTIWRHCQAGRMRRLHRGVYLIGPLTTRYTREIAAVLACGPGAVLSHGSAAALWALLAHPGPSAPVDVTVPGRGVSRPGIRARRVAHLEPREVTWQESIPVTTPGRTLLDLAADLGRQGRVRELEQAVAQADRRGYTTAQALISLIATHPRRPGVGLLRALVESQGGPVLTRSEAEERLLALIRRGRLPDPAVNVLAAGYEVDFLWSAERLVVEVDGFAFHAARSRFEGDRRRDAELAAAGFTVLRVTWRQITGEPEAVLVRIARALGQAGAQRARAG